MDHTGPNVFIERVYPFGKEKLPGLLIMTTTEASEIDTIGPPRGLMRELALNVEIYHSANDRPDARVEEIAEVIEQRIGDDPSLSGLALDCSLSGTSFENRGEGDEKATVYTLEYMITYRTFENDGSKIP